MLAKKGDDGRWRWDNFYGKKSVWHRDDDDYGKVLTKYLQTWHKHIVVGVIVAAADPNAIFSWQGDDVVSMEPDVEVENHVAWFLALLRA